MTDQIDFPRSRARNQSKRNKKKEKKQQKCNLTPTEKKLLEVKVEQVEQTSKSIESDPSNIFNKLKNEPRWSQHKPDVLIKAIRHYMKNPQSPNPTNSNTNSSNKNNKNNKKKNKNKNKNKNNQNSNTINTNQHSISANKTSNRNNNNNNRNNNSNNNKNNKFPSYKIINYAKKRSFEQMSNDNSNSNNNININSNSNRSKNGVVTEYVDTPEARRTTRGGFEQSIKDALRAKRRRRDNSNGMSNSIILDNSDPTIVQGSKNMNGDGNNSNTNSNSWQIEYPMQTLADVGGITHELSEKLHTLLLSMSCKELWNEMGSTPPRSVLLHGPPGSGKTLLAHALAGEAGIGFIKVSAPELIAGVSGRSEAKIRSLFETALNSEPCMVFIDEIDVIASKRENASKEMEKRIVAQLLTCLDDIARQSIVRRPQTHRDRSDSPYSMNNNNDSNDSNNQCNTQNGSSHTSEGGQNSGIGQNATTPQQLKPVKEKENETMEEKKNEMDEWNEDNENNDRDEDEDEEQDDDIFDYESKCVMFIAATNRPDSIDPALRRGDRFDSEIFMGMPNEDARLAILKILTKNMKLCYQFDYEKIARETSGFVGADLKTLTKEAGVSGVKRILKQLGYYSYNGTNWNDNIKSIKDQILNSNNNNNNNNSNLSNDDSSNNVSSSNDNLNDNYSNEQLVDSSLKRVFEKKENEGHNKWISPNYDELNFDSETLKNHSITSEDFLNALKFVEPSSRREGFATKPDVKWDSVGALNDIRQDLEYEIEGRILNPLAYKWFKMANASGILLFGPPGCGKTLLAKAVASHSGASFISIKGPELLNKYVGESERAIRVLFDRARSSQPCIIFFDELDALAPKRDGSIGDGGSGGGNNVTQRVVNQLLTEMDGISDRGRIFVIGATNRVDIIDPALMRPGRLGKLIYVSLPDANGRYEILKAHCKDRPLNKDINLIDIANDKKCDRFTGADLHSLVERACMEAIKEYMGLRRKRDKEKPKEKTRKIGMEIEIEDEDADGNGDRDEVGIDEMKNWFVQKNHFDIALKAIRPSVSQEQALMYDNMAEAVKSSQFIK